MKNRFIWFGIFAAFIVGISTFFVGCDNDVNAVVQYIGKVVHIGTTKPFTDLEVKVTNGEKIHCISHTDDNGRFTLSVKVDEVDGNYYLLVGDTSCVTKKIQLSGYGQATVDLGTIEIEGPTVPVVITKSISNISDNKATCGGNVTTDGRSFVTARGVCWSKLEYPTIDGEHTTNGSGKGEFTSQLSDLESGALYYVRAYATNKQGTVYGEQVSFTTKTNLPIVTTGKVENIRAISASGKGSVDANGYIVTSCGFCWSSFSTAPTISDSHTNCIVSNSFTATMTNLTRNTTYYCRAYATNENGISYGETKTFTTISGLPTVTTMDVSSFTETSAQTGGKITDDGDYNVTARGVCWSLSSKPTINDFKTTDGSGVGTFSSTITNIDLTNHSNAYYIRAYATNEAGTAYGNEVIISYQHYDYERLPKVEYNGFVYVVFHDIGEMDWYTAKQTCENLVYAGYDDWALMPGSRSIITAIMEGCTEGWMDEKGKPFIFISKENAVYAEGCIPNDFQWAAYYWGEEANSSEAYQGRYSPSGVGYSETYKCWLVCNNYYYYEPLASSGTKKWYTSRVRPIRRYKKNSY